MLSRLTRAILVGSDKVHERVTETFAWTFDNSLSGHGVSFIGHGILQVSFYRRCSDEQRLSIYQDGNFVIVKRKEYSDVVLVNAIIFCVLN